eukprot:scaffold111285_cov69-Phaeocystis_antarctica.AAC.2
MACLSASRILSAASSTPARRPVSDSATSSQKSSGFAFETASRTLATTSSEGGSRASMCSGCCVGAANALSCNPKLSSAVGPSFPCRSNGSVDCSPPGCRKPVELKGRSRLMIVTASDGLRF